MWRNRLRQLAAVSGRLPSLELNRRLFFEARRVPIAQRDIDETQPDVVFSTILVARFPQGRRIANVFYSQGINAPEYYAYQSNRSVTDIADFYERTAQHVTLMMVGTHDGLDRLHALCPRLDCRTLYVPQVVLLEPLAEPTPLPEAKPVRLLFVGRDYTRKGLPEVLEAVRALHDPFELHIVTTPDCPLQKDAGDLPQIHWNSN